MGRAKEQWMEEQARGFCSLPNWEVSAEMFPHHKKIRDLIKTNGRQGVCHFTGRTAQVLCLTSIVDYINRKFRELYEDPAKECGYESHDDEEESEGTGWHKEFNYILPNSRSFMATKEIFDYERLETANQELTDTIVGSIDGFGWVIVDPYGDTPDEAAIYNWENYKGKVIKEARNGVSYTDLYNRYSLQIAELLFDNILGNNDHITTLSKADHIFRCVNYNPIPEPLTLSELAAPPAEYAFPNRMSRQGQSRMYASFDDATPIEEAVVGAPDKYHCLGEFEFLHDVKVLDLCSMPYTLFLNVANYWGCKFLKAFAEAIRYHVPENDKLLYKPTQIMTDYIESVLKPCGVYGIIYPSSKRHGLRNLVLFFDQAECPNHMILVRSEVK